MLRAMDSAVSGLRAHQNKLDVLGNNIANVNTFGFKAQTYSFKDTMYQTSSASTTGTLQEGRAYVGGANAAQYGYGALMGSISTDFTSSTPTYVGGLNASINGSGFFITNSQNYTNAPVTLGNEDSTMADDSSLIKNADFAFTRVGQFSLDSNGYLVDANKRFVYGYRPTSESISAGLATFEGYKDLVPICAPDADLDAPDADDLESGVTGTFSGQVADMAQMKSIEIGEDGVIKGVVEITDDSTTPPVTRSYTIVLGCVAIAAFQNQDGLTKAGNNTYNAIAGDNTGFVTARIPGGATSLLMAGYLESSNTDLAKEFSDMITAERGFQANTKMVTVSDEILQELVNMKR